MTINSLLQYFPARGLLPLSAHHRVLDPGLSTIAANELLLIENVQRLVDTVRDKHNENLTLLERVDDLLDRLARVSH
jgi:hypothetical protein